MRKLATGCVTSTAALLCLFALAACNFEQRAWDKAEREATIEAYEEYLSQFPKGSFVGEAKANIEELTPAELVATWVHRKERNADWVVTLEDPESNKLAKYSELASRRTEYEYSKYNSSVVSKARHQEYVTIEDGTRVLTRGVTEFDAYGRPKTQVLYSPDGRTLGAYALRVTSGYRRVSWAPLALHTNLPVARYVYDGTGLHSG